MKILKGISLAPGITEGIVSLYISDIVTNFYKVKCIEEADSYFRKFV